MKRAAQVNLFRLFLAAIFLGMSAGAQADTKSAASLQAAKGAGAQPDLQSAKSAYKNKDYTAALKEFKPLADSGNAEAQFYVGLMYDNGEGVVQDYRQVVTHVQQAMTWYRKSANQGFAPAQTNLGILLETGGQVERNYKEAASWYRKAAEQGDSAAQFNLGLIYYAGRGDDIAPDYKEAASWLGKAAEQGNSAAQIGLGRMYEYGQSLPTDYVQAYKLYLLAEAAGNESAPSNKESVEAKMTHEQIQEAQALVKKKPSAKKK